jgi:NTE family protein
MIVPGKPEEKRRRIGAASLKAHPEPPDARLQVIRARLGTADWPDRDLRVTAVDATTGELRVFTRADGVDLVHAVAASCAVPLIWPAVPIDAVPYVDGGVRSPTNADLATGVDRVLVLAPLTRGTSRATAIHTQLRGLGTEVWAAAVSPDRPALKAIGKNVLEPSKRADAARAGFRQAETVIEKLTTMWRGQRSTLAQRNRSTTR